MNENDTEIVASIMRDAGFQLGATANEADVVLLNTCAVREKAESKVWQRLEHLKRQKRPAIANNHGGAVVGVLGCMAERLKEQLLEPRLYPPAPAPNDITPPRKRAQHTSDSSRQRQRKRRNNRVAIPYADVVVGPDAYRDLPRLVDLVLPQTPPLGSEFDVGTDTGIAGYSGLGVGATGTGTLVQLGSEAAVNVQLSQDETYADIAPVRLSADAVSAYVSVMRGCNNMCSFCIVPFTRGRERSRDLESRLTEVRRLSEEGRVKEVLLLGQNVNTYHDTSVIDQGDGEAGGGTVAETVALDDSFEFDRRYVASLQELEALRQYLV